MNPNSQAFWIALVFVAGMVGTACDDPPSNQGIPPKSKPGNKVKRAKSALPSTAKSVTRETPDTKGLETDSTDASVLWERATREIQTGTPKMAISTLQLLLQHHPEHEDANLKLAGLLGTDGKTQEALRLLEEGSAKVAKPGRLLIAAAELQARSGLVAQSNETIERLVSLSQGPDKARLKHATLLAELGAWKDSYAQFERLQEGTSLSQQQKIVFARVLEALGKVDRALNLLGRCGQTRGSPEG